MEKQERKFRLTEVHTKVGTMGELQLDQGFLDILQIKPGDFVAFLVDAEGGVRVKGEKKPQALSARPATPGTPRPDEVTQAPLFGDAPPKPAARTRRRGR